MIKANDIISSIKTSPLSEVSETTAAVFLVVESIEYYEKIVKQRCININDIYFFAYTIFKIYLEVKLWQIKRKCPKEWKSLI